MSIINDGVTFSEIATGLEKCTEYEFQVLAFTSFGDGPKSSIKVETTKKDGKRLMIMATESIIICYLRTKYKVKCSPRSIWFTDK